MDYITTSKKRDVTHVFAPNTVVAVQVSILIRETGYKAIGCIFTRYVTVTIDRIHIFSIIVVQDEACIVLIRLCLLVFPVLFIFPHGTKYDVAQEEMQIERSQCGSVSCVFLEISFFHRHGSPYTLQQYGSNITVLSAKHNAVYMC